MSDEAALQLENALNNLLSITEKSGNLRKDLKRVIVDSVSTLRTTFVNMKNNAEQHMAKINLLECEVKKAKTELGERQFVDATARDPLSIEGAGKTPFTSGRHVLPSYGGARKSYAEITRANIDKRYKLMVKSKPNQPTDTIKNVLKTKINPTEVKVGMKTLKSLKDGRVLIEVGSIDETNLLSANIKERCGDELEVNVPNLWKPRIIIRNIPHDITVENIEENILSQNAELNLIPGEVAARFKFSTKRGAVHMVIEVGPEARIKLLQTKLKIGWLICNVGDYVVAKSCFRCSRYNHRHQDCRGEETCPLCAGGHTLKDCKAPSNQHKCFNCMTYNRYSRKDKIYDNNSSLSKNCPSLHAVLMKYKQNTDY